MVSSRIEPFVPELAAAGELRAWHAIFQEISVSDFPDLPVPAFDAYVQRLCTAGSGHAVQRRWDARRDGGVLGTANAVLPTDDNRERAVLAVRVPTQERGAGVGTRLLRAALPRIRDHGCRWIASQVREGADGERWADALGFRQVLRLSSHRLDLRGVNPFRWPTDPPAGFTFRQWTDTAPDDLVAGFARARDAMADQPIGVSRYRHSPWSGAAVRGRHTRGRGVTPVRRRGERARWHGGGVHGDRCHPPPGAALPAGAVPAQHGGRPLTAGRDTDSPCRPAGQLPDVVGEFGAGGGVHGAARPCCSAVFHPRSCHRAELALSSVDGVRR